MEQDKNIQSEQAPDLNQEDHNKRNYKTKDADSPVVNTKDGDLKPTNSISENIHAMPADGQHPIAIGFEKED